MIDLRVPFVFFLCLSLLIFCIGDDNKVPSPILNPGLPLTRDEMERAARLPTVKTPAFDSSQDPMQVPGLFEGDISGVNISTILVKNAIINPAQKWPGGIVPYVIGAEFGREDRLRIAQAVIEFHGRTCIRLVPRRDQKDFIFYYRGGGCMSQVGRKGGQQLISLGHGCVHPGIIIHETLHALGFWHEQSRADRDDHIIVHWENIANGMETNFLKYTWAEIQGLGEPYDLGSVMHYAANAFARRPFSRTIVPRRSAENIGQRNGFSVTDLNKLNKLYECGRIATAGNSSQDCKDENQMCTIWSYLWQCQVNPNYMLNFCRKSCKSCSRASSVNTSVSSPKPTTTSWDMVILTRIKIC
uniref:Metalloendopeptidase n=1 Tax=Strigamia maritima TaxID=126957 RepID=T1IUP2_STRMM